jgi:excisionase family DNA binding protein
MSMGHAYTVKQAAKELGLEASHVRRLVRNGEIKGKKWGRDWRITNLNDYERRRKPKPKKVQAEVQEGKGETWQTEGSL